MTRRIALPIALVALASAGWWLSRPVDTPQPSVDDGAVRFEVGRTDEWRVEWTTEASAALPIGEQAPFDVSSAIRGTWAVTTVHASDDEVVQQASLRRLDSVVVLASDEPLQVDPGAIEGVVVTLTRTLDGGLTDIHFAPQAPAAARNTLTGLARLFSVRASDGERTSTYGIAQDVWTGDVRRTDAFVQLTGAPADATVAGVGDAVATWGRGGRLLRLVGEDHARAETDGTLRLDTHDHIDWTWTGTSDEPVRPAPQTLVSTPMHPQTGTAQRVAHLSTEALIATVTTFEGGDAGAVMWSGTARLAIDAGARQQVADIAARASTSHAVRELALDLLAHTPDGRAEGELLRALSNPVVADHPERAAYIGRLSFIRQPSDAAVDWLHRAIASDDVATARSARMALGAVARRYPDPDRALAPLRTDLPTDTADVATVLGALGNAAQAQDVPTLVAASADPRPRVRAAAVHALRHAPNDSALPVLRTSAADEHPGVQRAVISALASRPSDPASVRTLSEAAINGTLDPANQGLLTTLIASNPRSDDGDAALRAMMQAPTADATLRARMRAVLSR